MAKKAAVVLMLALTGCQMSAPGFMGTGSAAGGSFPILKLAGRTPEAVYSQQELAGNDLVLTRKGELILSSGNEPLWSQQLPGFAFAQPVVHGSSILVHTADGTLMNVNTSGKVAWAISRPAGSLISENGLAPQVVGGTTYAGFSSGKVLAIDTASGDIMWESSVGRVGFSDIARMNDVVHMVVGAKEVVVTTSSGAVHAFHRETGNKLWDQNFATVANVAEIGGDYVVTVRDEVVKIDGLDGTVLWRQEGTKIATKALPVGTNIAVGTQNGKVMILSSRDGTLLETRSGVRNVADLSIEDNVIVARDGSGNTRTVA